MNSNRYMDKLKHRRDRAICQLEEVKKCEIDGLKAYVYGSFARLEFRPNSDLDVYFDVSESEAYKNDRFGIVMDDETIEAVTSTQAKGDFLKAIQKDFIAADALITKLSTFDDFETLALKRNELTLKKLNQIIENTHQYTLEETEKYLDDIDESNTEKELLVSLYAFKCDKLIRRIGMLISEYLTYFDIADIAGEFSFYYDRKWIPELKKTPLYSKEFELLERLGDVKPYFEKGYNLGVYEEIKALLFSVEKKVVEEIKRLNR